MKDKLLKILGKYKVIGDTTYGLGYKEAEKLADEIIQELCYCKKEVESGKAICSVKLDCHLHDWRQKELLVSQKQEMAKKMRALEDKVDPNYNGLYLNGYGKAIDDCIKSLEE